MFKLALVLSVLVYCACARRNPPRPRPGQKIINIAVFLDDDAHSQISEVALNNALDILANHKMQQYYIVPYIHKLSSKDTYKAGKVICELVERGIAAIFGPESPEINDIIQSVSTSLEIPHFQTFWNPKLQAFAAEVDPHRAGTGNVFNLYPNPFTMADGIATMVKENDWTTYTVLYENDDGLMRLSEVLTRLNAKGKAVTFRKISGSDHRAILKEVKRAGDQKVLLDCDTDKILEILRQAEDVNLLEEYHSYILTNLDSHTLNWLEFRNIKSNVSGIRLLDPTYNTTLTKAVKNWELTEYLERNMFLLILPDTVKTKTALLHDALNVFATSYVELETTEKLQIDKLSCEDPTTSSHGLRMSSYIRGMKIERGLLPGPLTGAIAFDDSGSRSAYQLQLTEFEKSGFRPVGTWNPDEPGSVNTLVSSEERVKELQQKIQEKSFKVVSRLVDPYFMKKKDSQNGTEEYEGYAIDLIAEICVFWNCTFTFQKLDEGPGAFDPDTGKWNGLIGHLLDGKADLAICDLTITYERGKVVDFTLPFMTLGISILYAADVKEPPELLSFSHPLSIEVWLYMGTAYIVISGIIYIVARLNPNDWENPHPCDDNPQELENIWNLKNCFWLTMGSIMAQGCDILPKGISTRLVTGMWWFFSLIMTASYTANLAAFLTNERMGLKIENAEDLASQTKIKYGCLEFGSTYSFFRDSNYTTYHRMWVQMEQADPKVFEKDNNKGVERVLNSKRMYAFLMESSSIEYETQRHCDLIQVGGTLDSKGYGIAMPTNGPYRKSINEAILKMKENGKLDLLKTKWWKEKNQGAHCGKDKEASEEAALELGLDHVGGVFVVLAAGVILALIIAAGEFLWSIRKIAVMQKISLKDAFKKEYAFVVNIWARRKAAMKAAPDSNNKTNQESQESSTKK